MNKKIIILSIPLVILLALGIFQASLLVHEYTHVLQSKGPTSLRWDFRQNTWMSVAHSVCEEDCAYTSKEFSKFKTYTEKWADLSGHISLILLSIISGCFLTLIYQDWKKWRKNEKGFE